MTVATGPIAVPERTAVFAVPRTRVLTGLVALAALVVAALAIDSYPVGVVHDDAMYVILAKALATGQGYRWIHLPGAPAATHFPPGYPALLALLWMIAPVFPANVVLFKLVNACCVAGAAVLTMHLVRTRCDVPAISAALFALVALTGVPTLALSVMVMSEPLFLVCVLAALVWAERLVDPAPARPRHLYLLGLACGATTLVRTHGIALVGAIAIVLVIRGRRWRDAARVLATALLVIAPWQLWIARNTGVVPGPMRGNYESYGAWLAAGIQQQGVALLTHTVARTSASVGAMFATLFAPSAPGTIRLTVLVLLGLAALAGAMRMWRRLPITLLFLAFYSTIVICWPFAPARFFWAIWPLILLLLVEGVRELWMRAAGAPTPRLLRVAVAMGATGLVAGYGLYTVRGYRGEWWSSIPRTTANLLRPLVVWTATHTAPTDVVAVDGEGMVYLYTGRRTVPVQTFTVAEYFQPRTPRENAEAMRINLAAYPVTVVAVTSQAMWLATRELATAVPPTLAARDTFPGGIVLYPIHR